ncbi:serine/threonine protein phosphatase 2A 65 kDa regulatory subunit A beta isoform, putative [Entamoeba invadens IP1]|uniref:serine/threonine protein phosphatase 2A 65 kDa regulatory subunit A beta isoform, putative n=1 Tax=Entamoeba invadens IP1 TaxID=370355 RepID=UPI0002C3F3BB|nr:serine/threonine protein phosphatase 2A 65 kDa regulatory subunit A beta isoform, putative [Entamoeba invadens IP1]ELP85305.1 serine/threonine protein phosphatase 2A 65 kDa regulatory subunit A beta isoform, putative [Entamoeba invadens IP1]|eukprot:XP_004184651.1 serine/threonine protein phosphatase 2A 65 kDa regulatory subunit A beta isoform, putative [Entamoeba invadens IP1]
MEFRSIPKALPAEDIGLENAEKFLADFDHFSQQEDSEKRTPSIRKMGDAVEFLLSPEQTKELLTKAIALIQKEEIASIKVIAIQQIVLFVTKCHEGNISVYDELYPLMKDLVMDETEEVSMAARKVLKKLGEYLTDESQIEEYLKFVDGLIGNVDGFISTSGLDLFNYYSAKAQKEFVKKFIFGRLKAMTESVQFVMRKGAVSVLPAVLSNIEESDIQTILELFEKMSSDSVFSVRKTCAVVLIQIFKVFENNKQKVLEYIEKFIDDKSRFVRFQIIANFGKICQFLGKEYVSEKMITFFISNCASTSDSEQQYYGAFYFVTVLQTIGVEKWSLLTSSYEQLALSVHWKNRKCVASSLHLLANILGNEITLAYLIPALDKYLYDYDDIKQVAMMHVVDFIPILGQARSVSILTLLQNAIKTPDWRIRRTVAKQLGSLAEYTPQYSQYVEEICVSLLVDNVNKVRHAAGKEMGKVINAFLTNGYVGASALIQKFTDMASSPIKVRRVDFVTVATALFLTLPPDQFNPYILPSFDLASKDKVSCVRVAVATNIKKVMEKSKNYGEEIKAIAKRLEEDEDSDVRCIIKNGELNLFKRKKQSNKVVEDPSAFVETFEGFGRK